MARMNGELTRGKLISLKTNNYLLDFKNDKGAVFYIYHFNAKVSEFQLFSVRNFKVAASAKKGPSRGPAPDVKKENKRKIVNTLSQIFGVKFAFDGDKMLISPRELRGFREIDDRNGSVYEDRHNGVGFRVTYPTGDKEETAEGTLEECEQRVEMRALFDFMDGGGEHPAEVIQAIEIILRTNPAFHAA